MKKLLILLLVLSLCPFSALAGEASYPIFVTDQAGRQVEIEKEPETLVSGYYIATSLLIALDLDEKLVGVENNAQKRAVYALSAPEILELPGVGTVKELDLELCASLNPDLLILPLRLKDMVAPLEQLGMDVLLVNPESQDLLAEMIRMVAAAMNREERAEALLSFIDEQKQRLADGLEGVEQPRVYLAGNSSMLRTAGNNMYQSDLIRLAGGENVAGALSDTYWQEISYEQLLAWNPEVIVLAAEATYSEEDVLTDPNLASCDAVVNGRVYRIPNRAEAWDSPVPGSVLGAVWLSSVLHPERFSEADSIALIDEYYEEFYGFTYSKN